MEPKIFDYPLWETSAVECAGERLTPRCSRPSQRRSSTRDAIKSEGTRMRSYRFRIGSYTAVGALLIGLPACSSSQETSKSGEAPATPTPVGQVDETFASEAIAALPVGRVEAKDERGYAR